MGDINRRRFLMLSTGAAGSALLVRHLAERAAAEQGFAAPRAGVASLIQSQDGLLDVSLEAASSRIRLGDRQVRLSSYNGQTPGPRLEAKPGDRVRIRFTNRLDQPTNLHYHGLHISPQDKADNIFLSVPSGETFTYEFTIPAHHPSGIFYYHPHLHGTVAEQIFAGLGGVFVVRGDLDEIPEIRAAQEEFLFLKDFGFDARGQIAAPGHMDLMQGREGPVVTVNGQITPDLTIATGGLLRLRLVNASASRFYRLALEDHPLYLIATDGGAIAQPVELSELLLTPGERAEVLIKGDRPAGQYRLLNLPYSRGGMMMGMGHGMGSMTGMGHGMRQTEAKPQVLAMLSYRGAVSPLPLPQELLTVASLPEPVKRRRIELSMAMGSGMTMANPSGHAGVGGMPMQFLFNGQPFDSTRIDATAKLDTVEDWDLVNLDPDGMEHPFHLHVNHFQIIRRNGQPEPYQAWKDTVLIRQNETVRIRIPFRNFVGKVVYHCHVLDHEDLGMMGLVEVQV
ncbi:MAG: multicopper oxidase family protein [Elainella sp.]